MATTEQSLYISAADCAAWRDSHAPPALIDVRSPSEYAAGHVPGSVNIPLNELRARIEDIPGERPPVLICQSGRRAENCAALLLSLGMNPLTLKGGLNEWKKEGLALTRSTRTDWSLERQVRLGAGLLLLGSLVLAGTFGLAWLSLAALVGIGLTFAGISDACLLGSALSRMPWNQLR